MPTPEEIKKMPDAQLDKAKEVILNWNSYKGLIGK
jgi:hypothetical protein